jgi:hypothetical protein
MQNWLEEEREKKEKERKIKEIEEEKKKIVKESISTKIKLFSSPRGLPYSSKMNRCPDGVWPKPTPANKNLLTLVF